MDQADIRPILANLLQDETLEQTMIALYDALLRVDVQGCIAKEERDNFVSGIQTLKKDSEYHRLIIEKMIEKYK
ncbi:MAG: hypothetical protein HGA67_04110 [Candidatus Yonathbacteria bacterium]|nr:hypothetical protein [Candidatus Yonathbacteria bacterium]